jgi:hypothetical protein
MVQKKLLAVLAKALAAIVMRAGADALGIGWDSQPYSAF